MSKEYPQKIKEFLQIVSLIDNREDRIALLIEYAEKFFEVPPEIAMKPFPLDHRVDYCESEVYVWTQSRGNDRFKYYFAVENPHGISAKALASIFQQNFSDEKGEEILNLDNDLIFEIFGENLSMGKNLGLTGILQMMKQQTKKLMNT